MKLICVALVLFFGHLQAFALESTLERDLVDLGKALFFDPRLSKDGSISCNSCHNLMHNGSDGRPGSVGVGGKIGGRTAPTVWNVGAYSAFFWDGRAATLEDQAKGPLVNPIEMAMPDHKEVESRVLASGYEPYFEKAFRKKGAINIDNIAKAIATFERSLVVRNSPYDRYVAGDKKAMTAEAVKGHELVNTIGCTSCHSGADFSGPKLSDGTPFLMKFPTFPEQELEKKYKVSEDLGRFASTNKPEDKNMWRVPSWRNVALVAPYFHNGSAKTLEEAVKVMGKMQLNKTLTDPEVHSIVSFLNSLTSEFPEISSVKLPMASGKSLF